jgi:transcriptional regulator GlxA family with amidase domain
MMPRPRIWSSAGVTTGIDLALALIEEDARREVAMNVARILEDTEDRIESIAEDCGFGSEEQMRAAFVRLLKIPPREYRKRFASTD